MFRALHRTNRSLLLVYTYGERTTCGQTDSLKATHVDVEGSRLFQVKSL